MTVQIRPANAGDANAIAVLSRQAFHDTFAAVNTAADMEKFMSGPFSMERLLADFASTENYFLAAFLDGQLAGYAKLQYGPAPEALGALPALEISRLYADKSAIGKGIGKSLMEACLAKAREEKKSVLWLGVWEHNQRAIDFYQKFGFVRFGDHPFVLGDDVQTDWLMKKML